MDAEHEVVTDDVNAVDARAAEFARLVDEGVLIIGAALRMRVKNQIVVRVLAQGGALAPEDYDRIALAEIQALVTENRASAEYLGRQAERAQRRRGSAQHMSDYRAADVDSLDLRRRVAEALVAALETMSTRPEYRQPVIERARNEAMVEMFRARMPTSISAEEPTLGPAREERMRILVKDLIGQLRARERGEPAPRPTASFASDRPREAPNRPWRWFRDLWH